MSAATAKLQINFSFSLWSSPVVGWQYLRNPLGEKFCSCLTTVNPRSHQAQARQVVLRQVILRRHYEEVHTDTISIHFVVAVDSANRPCFRPSRDLDSRRGCPKP